MLALQGVVPTLMSMGNKFVTSSGTKISFTWGRLSAILFALQSCLPLLDGSYVKWFSDSQCLRIAQAEGRDWRSQIDDFLMTYRSTLHSTTGVSPAELLFGWRIRNKLPQLQEFTCEDKVRQQQ